MAETERVFFALLPPEEIKKHIYNFVTSLATDDTIKIVPKDNYHITLLFLGDINKNIIPEIINKASCIKCPSFDLHLNTTGHFKKSKVLWLGTKSKSLEIEYLLDSLTKNLNSIASLNLPENNYNFTPHITIFKKVFDIDNHLPLKTNQISLTLRVEKFCLVKSIFEDHNFRYEILAEF
jgi:2'-5' RNA ligase